MNRLLTLGRRGVLPLALLSLGACASLGGLGGWGGGDVRGEVARVDTRRQEIVVRRSYGGSVSAYFDRRTDVVYRNRRYSVRALEPGDVVTLRIDRGSRGMAYARQIHVERSVRDYGRGGYGDYGRDDRRDRRDRNGDYDDYGRGRDDRAVQGFSGRVGRVDARRGVFQLRAEYGGNFTVSVPARGRSGDYERLRRLRSGDHVRIEGRLVGNRRIELVRFR